MRPLLWVLLAYLSYFSKQNPFMILNALFQHLEAIRPMDEALRERLITDLEIVE
ncbi:MAG: hypothetical protein JNM68_12505, partial [Dinghuibacter sp.]|nr:hypothetical protein [Dinghuibacter sp.]